MGDWATTTSLVRSVVIKSTEVETALYDLENCWLKEFEVCLGSQVKIS